MAPTGFAHLHVHTEFSALDGLTRVDDAFKLAAQRGESALAVTDHGTLGGLWKAQKAADKHGVKLIPGVELYIAIAPGGYVGDRFQPGEDEITEGDVSDDSDAVEGESAKRKVKKYLHLTVLATNAAGWKNLVQIANKSEGTKKGKYPLADVRLIKEHAEGLIVLTGCLGGPVLGPLSRGDRDVAAANLEKLIDAVGKDNVFVEVMEHGIPQESAILPDAARLAAEYGLPLVATNDSHHTHAEDATAHEAWLALRSGTVLSDPHRYHFHGEGYHLRSEAEMRALRPEPWWQGAVDNTGFIASRVAERVLPEANPSLPAFPTPEGFESNLAYYMHLVKEGAARIYGEDWATERPDVRERLNEELQVIQPMGFIDYFLIVHEVVSWSRSQGILVGPGRGSAAGSLTAYTLGITGIDPLENNLLFERFLEPGRSDFPDIDIDFERSRREDVLAHLEEVWGAGHVALIGSFGAAKTKRAVRDAARVLELPAIGNKLAKLIPSEGGSPLGFDQLFDENVGSAAAFRQEVLDSGEDATRVIELARGFDDAVNGVGIHACGVVISDRDLTDLIPLRKHKNGHLVTQWDSKDVEGFGLLKLDVLALRNLDIASKAVQYIQETTGEVIDVDNLPHPNTQGDPRVDKAWQLLRDGRTAGIFQMESPAMTNLARQVQPENLTDLSAVVALFRPGPLSAGMDQQFHLRKHGKERIDYGQFTHDPHEQEWLAKVMGETYGVFVFQEQLMMLGTIIAGLNAEGRSMLRRAVGKKDAELMAQVGEQFRQGATVEFRDENGEVISPVFAQETADKLWEAMKGSASYLFNASHSAAYAQLAYVTAYLKANWPGAYGAAILSVTTDTEKRIEALRALPEEGIEILPPDVNASAAYSTPDGVTAVRLGLAEIKNVGQAGERIVEVREATRPFESFHDVVHRVRRGGLNEADGEVDMGYLPSNQIGALIEAGAFDAFGPRMGLLAVSRIIKTSPNIPVPDIEWGLIERSARQRGVLLVSIGEHPLRRFQAEVAAWRSPSREFEGGFEIEGEPATPIPALPNTDGARVTTIGLLSRFAEGSYRGGRKASITLEGSNASIHGIMWDRTLGQVKGSGWVPRLGWPVAMAGRITLREFEQEDEDGEITITTLRELMVDRVFDVKIDDPVTGSWNGDVVVPRFEVVHDAPATLDIPDETPPVPTLPPGLFDEPEGEPEPQRAPGEVVVLHRRPGRILTALKSQAGGDKELERALQTGATRPTFIPSKNIEYEVLSQRGDVIARIVPA